MDPQAIFKAFPRDNQLTEPYYLQSRDIDRNVVATLLGILLKLES